MWRQQEKEETITWGSERAHVPVEKARLLPGHRKGGGQERVASGKRHEEPGETAPRAPKKGVSATAEAPGGGHGGRAVKSPAELGRRFGPRGR